MSEYFGVDPVILRVIFVLWALSGSGVLAYIVLWIILPDKATLDLPHSEAVRQNVSDIGTEARGLGQDLQGIFGDRAGAPGSNRRLMFLGGFIIVTGLALLADNLHLLGWFRLHNLWPVALILGGIVLLNRALRAR